MFDVVPLDTADARKSKELTEGDLGMAASAHQGQPKEPTTAGGPGSREAEAMRKKTSSPPAAVDVTTMSESGYGSTDDLDSSRASSTRGPVYSAVVSLPPPIFKRPSTDTAVEEPDNSIATVLGAVVQTKIITTVFEVAGNGLGCLHEDFVAELERWFRSEGALVVASELVWSVPAKRRKPAAEVALKQALFAALRRNNKRVLDLRWPSRRWSRPVCLPDSGTQELSGRDKGLNAYQGTYRRYYDALMPLQHEPTAPVHSEYWAFSSTQPQRPAPHRFLFGPRRALEELTTTTLLAINATAITFR